MTTYRVAIGDKAAAVRACNGGEAFTAALARLYGRRAAWLPDTFATLEGSGYGTVYRHLTIRQRGQGRAEFTTAVTGRVAWSVRPV